VAKFVDFDPERGVATYEDMYDGHIQLHYRQDVEPVLELAKTERINGLTDHGIKEDLWLYARIPPVIILEMKFKYGVDIFKRDHLKRAFEIINRDYPYLKTTEKRHTLAH
jgi:hypothetical protein